MVFGVVDVGSNTLRLLVAEVSPGGLRPLRYERVITRLARGAGESGRISPEAAEKSMEALKKFAGIIRGHGVEKTWCVGTSALREAGNSSEFLEKARLETGLEIEVVSGEREAGLTARGVLSSIERPPAFLIIDIGGGSTEYIFSAGSGGLEHLTVPVGVVKMAEAHMRSDPPSEGELMAIRAEADRVSDMLREKAPQGERGGARLIGTAGTANTLAAIDLGLGRFDRLRVHGHVMTLERLNELASRLSALPLSERARVRGLEPERADLIIPGIILTISHMEALGFGEILISSAGLLEGMALELYERGTGR